MVSFLLGYRNLRSHPNHLALHVLSYVLCPSQGSCSVVLHGFMLVAAILAIERELSVPLVCLRTSICIEPRSTVAFGVLFMGLLVWARFPDVCGYP
jgi:hypothetical protein